jgi:hypothetical protein
MNPDFQTMRVKCTRLLADAPYAAAVPPAEPAKTKKTVSWRNKISNGNRENWTATYLVRLLTWSSWQKFRDKEVQFWNTNTACCQYAATNDGYRCRPTTVTQFKLGLCRTLFQRRPVVRWFRLTRHFDITVHAGIALLYSKNYKNCLNNECP